MYHINIGLSCKFNEKYSCIMISDGCYASHSREQWDYYHCYYMSSKKAWIDDTTVGNTLCRSRKQMEEEKIAATIAMKQKCS